MPRWPGAPGDRGSARWPGHGVASKVERRGFRQPRGRPRTPIAVRGDNHGRPPAPMGAPSWAALIRNLAPRKACNLGLAAVRARLASSPARQARLVVLAAGHDRRQRAERIRRASGWGASSGVDALSPACFGTVEGPRPAGECFLVRSRQPPHETAAETRRALGVLGSCRSRVAVALAGAEGLMKSHLGPSRPGHRPPLRWCCGPTGRRQGCWRVPADPEAGEAAGYGGRGLWRLATLTRG